MYSTGYVPFEDLSAGPPIGEDTTEEKNSLISPWHVMMSIGYFRHETDGKICYVKKVDRTHSADRENSNCYVSDSS